MVIVLMGVSGSGKTTVGRALAAHLGWSFEDADAWHAAASVAKMQRGVPLTDADRRPWIAALNRSLRGWVDAGRDVVLACSALRRWQRTALAADVPDARAVRCVYLRGTYGQVDRQLRQRTGHFMPEALLRSQFDSLEPPDAAEALAVDVGQPIEVMVRAIAGGLGVAGARAPSAATPTT